MVEPESEEEAGVRYIACRACGTRIRADRESCLRCGEPLEAAPETVSLQTISSGRPLLVAIGTGVIIVAAAAAIWFNRPQIERNDAAAQPLASPRPAAAPGAKPAAATAPVIPVTATGSSQVASAESGLPPDTMVDASGILAASDDEPAARDRYAQAASQNPQDPAAQDGYGRALARAGDHAAAVEKFARASELMPNNWVYHFNQAYLLAQDQDWSKALLELRQAARLAPDQFGVQFDLAVALHKTDDEAAAIPQYQQAMRLAPNDPRTHLALALSFERTGRPADARAQYQAYLSAAPSASDADKIRTQMEALPVGNSVP